MSCLGTIRTDAPIETAEGAYKVGEGNKAEAVRLLQELEIHSLIPRFGLDNVAPATAPEEVPTEEAEIGILPLTPAGDVIGGVAHQALHLDELFGHHPHRRPH